MPLFCQDLLRPGILIVCFNVQDGNWPWWAVQSVPLITDKSGQGHPHGEMDSGQITTYRSTALPPGFFQKVTSNLKGQKETFGKETEGNVPEG